MADYATVDDVIALKRPLTAEEVDRCKELLPSASAFIRDEAKRVGKDMDVMIASGYPSAETVKMVAIDIVMREINAPADNEAASQISQSAGGYSLSYTPLSPGGGIYLKRSEFSRLGLSKQRIRALDLLG